MMQAQLSQLCFGLLLSAGLLMQPHAVQRALSQQSAWIAG